MSHLAYNTIGQPYFRDFITHIESLKNETSQMYLDPTHILNLSTYYFLRGEIKKSHEVVDWGHSMYKNNYEFRIQKCKLYILQQHYEEAIFVLNTLKNQENPYALFERVKLSMLTNKRKEAKYYVDMIIEQITEKDKLYLPLTFFLAKNNFQRCAKECWEVVSKASPKTNDFVITEVAYNYAIEEYEKAFKICNKFNKYHKDNLIICFYLTSISILLDKLRKANNLIIHLKELVPSCIITNQLEEELENRRFAKIQAK